MSRSCARPLRQAKLASAAAARTATWRQVAGGSTTSKSHSSTLLRAGTHAQQVRNEPSNSTTAATRCTTRCAACRHTGRARTARRAALCAGALRASALRAVQPHPEQGQLAQQRAVMRAGAPPARQRWREHALRAKAALRSKAGAQTQTVAGLGAAGVVVAGKKAVRLRV